MQRPIGIFDSGIGGLTVLKEIRKLMPAENLIYFGDTARVPYGTKSRETVTSFSVEIAEFLLSLDVKMIVVACNTASALALPALNENFDITITGVIKPGAQSAVNMTRNGKIGVIGTRATIGSGAYEREIHSINSRMKVFSRPCPVFVSLVEEGWTEHPATRLIAEDYLNPLKSENIDVLLLGCTHYPLLRPLLEDIMGNNVTVVDSAGSCAVEVKRVLEEKALANDSAPEGSTRYYVSDMPDRFVELSSRFLGEYVTGIFHYQGSGVQR